MLTGGEILIECLKKEGVDTIFGYPGGAVLPIYDALYDSDIRHILTRHEQGAAHAADGYARATGRPGVCLATSGPGATNLVTGLATAAMDSVPMVALTGQVPTSLLGKDSFQEADITGITLPITKHNYLVREVADLPRIIKEAFYIATTGRPGPVLIDIPRDVSAGKAEYRDPGPIGLRGYQPRLAGEPVKVAAAAEAISKARCPVIYAGGGVINSGAAEHLRKLAETIMAPVAVTLMGLGGFPADHPLFLGMLGMHGSKYANYAISECDLLLAIGVRFDDRVTGKVETFAPHAKIVHIDIDQAELSKNVPVGITIAGDARTVLVDLLKNLTSSTDPTWNEKIRRWKQEHPLSYEQNEGLRPQAVIREIANLTVGKPVRITTEVGQNQMWTAQYFPFTRPRSFISSGGLGTMGYGLPAAIGVQVACPDELVFDIAGDGSIQMNIQELATAVNYELPINVIILNNSYLGMVRQWQELFYDRRYSHTELKNPDFVRIAEAYGAEGLRVEKKAEIRPALEQAIASKKPVLIDFVIEREENVMPMVPPGESINKMIG
jgi:acetolactate synthase-1/2/3 large subunit